MPAPCPGTAPPPVADGEERQQRPPELRLARLALDTVALAGVEHPLWVTQGNAARSKTGTGAFLFRAPDDSRQTPFNGAGEFLAHFVKESARQRAIGDGRCVAAGARSQIGARAAASRHGNE